MGDEGPGGGPAPAASPPSRPGGAPAQRHQLRSCPLCAVGTAGAARMPWGRWASSPCSEKRQAGPPCGEPGVAEAHTRRRPRHEVR